MTGRTCSWPELAAAVLAFAAVVFAEPVFAAKRAFVVGIDAYDNLGEHAQLKRAVNDARAIAGQLDRLGYDTKLYEDLTRSGFNAAWQRFLDSLSPDDVVTFFFAGHGIEINGQNYLVPRDLPANIRPGYEEQIKRESLSMPLMMIELRERKPKVTVIVLDACRDHPLMDPATRSLGTRGGLAAVPGAKGTFVIYSAGSGQTALDRLPENDTSQNSLFTRTLAPLLGQPGLTLRDLAKRVQLEVSSIADRVRHEQYPAYYDNILGEFCFAGCKAGSDSGPASGAGASADAKPSLIPNFGGWFSRETSTRTAAPGDTSAEPDACNGDNPPIACLWKGRK